MNNELSEQSCMPCQDKESHLNDQDRDKLYQQLPDGWEIVEDHHLEKNFRFKDFKESLEFVNRVGAIAEEQGHHPDIYLTYGKVGIKIWTHKIDGLTENDFIFAAKVEKALRNSA